MKSYPAKILLFGEYTIIKGSAALAMPLSLYAGEWKFVAAGEKMEELQQSLPELLVYLEELEQNGALLSALDLSAFRLDLSKGLYFSSTIPGGYGAGSSGALCAAIYQRYLLLPLEAPNLLDLKNELGQIESFFHGASSGIDPLICFLQVPLHILSKEKSVRVDLPETSSTDPVLFLLNTQMPRKTEPLVNIFLQKCEEHDFSSTCLPELIKNNDQAIGSFLSGNWKEVGFHFQKISALQLTYFEEMIPLPFREIWKRGLDENTFSLKLCGAGGGGFILGLTENWQQAQKQIEDFDLLRLEW